MGGDNGPRRSDAFEAAWRRRFTGFAEAHDDDASIAGWTATGLEARLRHFVRLWRGRRANALWLDAGCGAGTYARYLEGHGCDVVGLDYSLPTIGKARSRGGPRTHWAVADVGRLPVRTHSFDGALCFGVVQALAASDAAMRELIRAVRPGGEVWLDALNGWCVPHAIERLLRRLRGRPVHVRYESPARLRRLARHCGLSEVRLYWLPIVPSRMARFQWIVETPVVRALLRAVPFVGALLSHALVVRGRVGGAA